MVSKSKILITFFPTPGLFHRAISQSGCVLNTWLYSRYPKEQAKSLAQRVNCPIDSSASMVKCLKEVDAREIVRTHIEMTVHFPESSMKQFSINN